MKQLFHICLTAHSEVLLRNIDDVRLFTNLMALAGRRTDSDILVDSQMSTHTHEIAASEEPYDYLRRKIISITRAFNYRHCRRGPLFDPGSFVMLLQGPRHAQMAMNYVLRQGLHHGQSETAFSYPWSTCNYVFQNERGAGSAFPANCGKSALREFLPKNAEIPDEWRADGNGILLRPCFEQIAMVENWYGTARSFMYSMIRRTTEEWLAEQSKDDVRAPVVSLELLEKGYSSEEIRQMLAFEGNTKYREQPVPDMEICTFLFSALFRDRSAYVPHSYLRGILIA